MGSVGRSAGTLPHEEAPLMNIVVGSAFRNCAPRVQGFMQQVTDLLFAYPDPKITVRVIAAEGDSRDATREQLEKYPGVHVLDAAHGGPYFGSTEAPERMKALSQVGNTIFAGARPDDDVLVYVESDLLWDAATVKWLIQIALERVGGYDVFAPLVFAGEHFYDTWGFRGLDGERFAPFAPYHSSLNGLTEVSSVGSCLVMRGEAARACRIKNDYCLVGWCEDARAQGFKIAVDPTLRVEHPC